MMCGSAMQLVGSSEAVMLELSYAGHSISEATPATPLLRTNHPLLDGPYKDSYGDSGSFLKNSEKRLKTLHLLLDGAGATEKIEIDQLNLEGLMKLLTRSKVICNPTTLAVVACDVQSRQLWVEYRERRLMTRRETRSVITSHPAVADKILAAGLVESRAATGEADRDENIKLLLTRPRLMKGETEKYRVLRRKYEYMML